MKLAKIVLAIASFAITNATVAGTITGSSNIEFVAFDGQKVKKKDTIQVNDNKPHQIVLSVSSIYKSGSDNQFFESSPIILAFNGHQENIQILTPHLRTQYDIDNFKKNPTFTVKTVSGQAIDYQKDTLKGEGFMPNSNIINTLAAYNAGNGTVAMKQFSTTAMAVPMPAVMPMKNTKATQGKVMVQGENIAEQQLQYWFQQADKETQQRFLNWAKKH